MSAPTPATSRRTRPATAATATRSVRSTRAAASARVSAAVLLPAAALAALLAAAAPARATTTPAPTTPPPVADSAPKASVPTTPTGRPGKAEAERVEAALREVVDLQLLQPTCGERGALTVAALQALRTIGVEVKSTGLPKIDLGPLGWIGIGSQYPGRAVALELHLLPAGPVPVNLTVGEKACPPRPGTPAPRTPAPTSTATPAPSTPAPPATRTPAASPTTAPQPAAQPELARTGGGSPTWPYLASGAGLLAAGGATAVAAARRRRTG